MFNALVHFDSGAFGLRCSSLDPEYFFEFFVDARQILRQTHIGNVKFRAPFLQFIGLNSLSTRTPAKTYVESSGLPRTTQNLCTIYLHSGAGHIAQARLYELC